MTEITSAGNVRRSAAALSAGRTAALIVLAIGVAETLAIVTPKINVAFVYLVMVLIAAFLEGMAAAIVVAAASGIAYGWLVSGGTSPQGFSLAVASILVAIPLALATRGLRRGRLTHRSLQTLLAPSTSEIAALASKESLADSEGFDSTLLTTPVTHSFVPDIVEKRAPFEEVRGTVSSDQQLRGTTGDVERVASEPALTVSFLSLAVQAGADDQTTAFHQVRNLPTQVEELPRSFHSANATQTALRDSLAIISGERDTAGQRSRAPGYGVEELESLTAASAAAAANHTRALAALATERDTWRGQAAEFAARIESLQSLLSRAHDDEKSAREELSAIVGGRDAALRQATSLANRLEELERALSDANDASSDRDADAVESKIRASELERSTIESSREMDALAGERDRAANRIIELEQQLAHSHEQQATLSEVLALHAKTNEERDATLVRSGDLEAALASASEREAALNLVAAEQEYHLETQAGIAARVPHLERLLAEALQRESALRSALARQEDAAAGHENATSKIRALERSLLEATDRETSLRRLVEERESILEEDGSRLSALERSLASTTERENALLETVSQHASLLGAHEIILSENERLKRDVAELTRRESEWLEEAQRHARSQHELAAAGARIEALEATVNEAAARETALRDAAQLHAKVVTHRDAAVARVGELEHSFAQLASREAELRKAASHHDAAVTEQGENKARIAELERALADKATGEAAEQGETERKLAKSLAETREEHEKQLAEAAAERDRLAARVQELERAGEQMILRVSEHQKNERERLQTEWAGKLQTLAALVAQHEQGLAQARHERDQAHSTARDLSSRIGHLLERHANDGAAAERSWQERLTAAVAELTSRHESGIEVASREKEAARTEARELASRVEELQLRAGADRALIEEELRSKLESTITNLTSERGADLARAVAEREQARAEIEALKGRVQELQSELATQHARHEAERLRHDAEGDARLQSIVTNLASDHESDIGQAVVDREAARAEARSLSQRVTTLQQRIEADRELFLQARTRWSEIERKSGSQHRQILQEVRTAAETEIAALRARPDIATPTAGRRPTVLIVQSDPMTRAASKEAVESIGYDTLTAGDGLAALRLASARRPDIVMADSFMTKVDGAELVQFLKSKPETAQIKVILIWNSGSAMKDELRAAARHDYRADYVLPGGSNLATLRDTLAAVLAAGSVVLSSRSGPDRNL